MNTFAKNLFMWAAISLVMVVLFNLFNQPPQPSVQFSYSEFLQSVDSGDVLEVRIQGQRITGATADGKRFITYAPDDPGLVNKLIANKVQVTAEPQDDSPWYMTLLISWFPMLLLIGVWIFFMRQMQSGGGKAMSFGRSRAKMISQEHTKVTFEDVAGADEAKEELAEIVAFLSEPRKFTRLGGRIPKGVLLVGPPGTGKTLLSRAVAGEAGVPFFSISGSDFVEMFVGVGAARVRDLFIQGKKNAPCLIFIDELDAVGRQRGAGLGGGHDEREQTLNQLLVEMDGFEANESIIIMAATNRPDILDPALLRPGRFDRQIVVDRPDREGRKAILAVHSKGKPLAPGVELDSLAAQTPGFTGADLANLVNEAALLTARRHKRLIEMDEFEEAVLRVIAGPEKKSRLLSEEEKLITAYHETGHALVAHFLPHADPVHKISIISRGQALGYTITLPTEDKFMVKKKEILDKLSHMLAGRVAEEIRFDDITTGASNDLQRASETARRMITQYGMSEELGPLTFGHDPAQPFVGRDYGMGQEYSDETARKIDSEIRRVVDEAYDMARTVLNEHRAELDQVSMLLIEKETIDREEFEALLRGEEPEAVFKARDEARERKAAESKRVQRLRRSRSEQEDESLEPEGHERVAPGLSPSVGHSEE